MEARFIVTARWDARAQVWVAESDEVPGLITESPTLEALKVKLSTLVPELLVENSQWDESNAASFELRHRGPSMPALPARSIRLALFAGASLCAMPALAADPVPTAAEVGIGAREEAAGGEDIVVTARRLY